MEEHIEQLPWLTISMVSHYNSTYSEEDALPTVIGTRHQTAVSGVTDSFPVNSSWLRNYASSMAATPSCAIMTASTEADDSQGTSKRGSRPKGTTNASKQSLNDLIREAFDECAKEVVTLKTFALDKTIKHGTANK
jgi:hypothetical protein